MKKEARAFVRSVRDAVRTHLQAEPGSESDAQIDAKAEKSAPLSKSMVDSLSSVEGITKSAVPLFGMWLLYKAVPPIVDYFHDRKEENEHVEREKRKALRNYIETKMREDKKDSTAIRKEVRKDFIERERKKAPPRPKAVRGHWEGNVFIPAAEQPRRKP